MSSQKGVPKLIGMYEQNAGASAHARKQAKLPEIELPNFSGNIFERKTLIDLFNSIQYRTWHRQMLQHLKLLLLLIGEAAKFISSISLSIESYQVAVKILHEQYSDFDRIINKMNAKFLHLKPVVNDTSKHENFTQN
jgi:hypothetical protein